MSMESWAECIITPDKDSQIKTSCVHITATLEDKTMHLSHAQKNMEKTQKTYGNHAELKSGKREEVSPVSNLEDTLTFL